MARSSWKSTLRNLVTNGRSVWSGRVPTKSNHSKVLSRPDGHLYEFQAHVLKPECTEDYLKEAAVQLTRVSVSKDFPVELVGSWTTAIGSPQNQIVHLWRYTGYKDANATILALRNDKTWSDYLKSRDRMILTSSNQIVLPFTFWDIDMSPTKNPKGLYELRSYTLRPGTLIEWGQQWEKGIKYRKDEAIGGWFSQIGIMHQVHHMWAYKDLNERHETRQSNWQLPGWDECVQKTVPLMRHMETRIMLPTPYSPFQ